MKKHLVKLINFWNEDRSLTIMLLLLLLFNFVFVPSLSLGKAGEIFIKIIYSVVLLTGILSVAKHIKYVIAVSILAIIGLVLNWLSEVDPTRSVLIANDLGVIIYNSIFSIAILIKTFQPGDI